MEADGDLPISGAADIVGVAVCDLCDAGRERLARLYLSLGCRERNGSAEDDGG
jgi:hypothetical protein